MWRQHSSPDSYRSRSSATRRPASVRGAVAGAAAIAPFAGIEDLAAFGPSVVSGTTGESPAFGVATTAASGSGGAPALLSSIFPEAIAGAPTGSCTTGFSASGSVDVALAMGVLSSGCLA
jgi:hypothetical protein